MQNIKKSPLLCILLVSIIVTACLFIIYRTSTYDPAAHLPFSSFFPSSGQTSNHIINLGGTRHNYEMTHQVPVYVQLSYDYSGMHVTQQLHEKSVAFCEVNDVNCKRITTPMGRACLIGFKEGKITWTKLQLADTYITIRFTRAITEKEIIHFIDELKEAAVPDDVQLTYISGA